MSLELIVTILIIGIILIAGLLLFIVKKYSGGNTLRIIKPGRTFDNYRIIKPIKRGGMATIYHATDVKTNKPVALKIMHENLVDDEDLITKFLYEGDILERFNRKYTDAPIVKVYRHSRESNDVHGRPFIALEYIEGEDLDDLLRTGKKFSVNDAVKIISETAKALSVAHKEDVWHRDVSPGNVIINKKDGTISDVKIIDFGVAKHEYIGKQTPDGSIHGKPPFMSPEQCRNEIIDGRSDIYALGVLFYTLLNGSPPFISGNPLEVMKMHESEPVPPLPDTVPDSLRKIISRMMEKNVEDRFQSIDEVLRHLNEISETETQVDIPIPEVSQDTEDTSDSNILPEPTDSKNKRLILSGIDSRVKIIAIGIIVTIFILSLLFYFISRESEPPFIIGDIDSIRFPATVVDESNTESYIFQNPTSRPVNITGARFAGEYADEFSVNVDLPMRIEPADMTSIPIDFSPSRKGDMEASFIVVVDNGELQTLEVPVYGEAVERLFAEMSFEQRFNFEQHLTVGERLSNTYTIQNTGNKYFDIISIEFTGSDANVFSLNSQVPINLPPGTETEIELIFNPISSGQKTANMIIHTTEDAIGSPRVEVIGNASERTFPTIIADRELSFPSTIETEDNKVEYVVSNVGSETLVLNNYSLTGSDNREFKVLTDFPVRIPPNNESVIELSFEPLTSGEKYASLEFESNDPDNQVMSISLSGLAREYIDPAAGLDRFYEEARELFFNQRYRDAERAFTDILERDEYYAQAYYMRGRSFLEMGEYWRAVEDFDELFRHMRRIPSASRERIHCDGLYYAALALTQQWLQSDDEDQRERINSHAEGRWLDFIGACRDNREQINNAQYWLDELRKD